MRILGHRGASADFPENTLEAFRGAVEQRADGVELDVMRCASGELVVCHDEWLDRLAGLRLEVLTTPWHRLQKVDVGSRLGFAPARIPLLHDVFDALPERAFVNVEIKCETLDDHGLSVAVGELLTSRKLNERVFVSSFNPLCLVRLAQSHPRLKRGLLIDPDKAWAPQAWFWLPVTAMTSVHPHYSQVSANRVNRWHAQGWEVAVWTVDDVTEAKRLRAMGVDWVITNRPGELRQKLKAL
ncbi:MAG: glycerophosphodiester phosphodiesterase [Archangium gephyra]|uniref:Glycerophosphodiester phosphodiesterase n=1 Tax=Archangium gephyra TaxID=48 RepID=A0A2W5UXY1_9BACT|nr:MAG: glycerophosphodiester phosphodiesterase [Archangium gephyra]